MVIQIIVLAVVFLLLLIIGFAGTIALIQKLRTVSKDTVSQDDDSIGHSCEAVGLEEIATGGLSIFWQPFVFSMNNTGENLRNSGLDPNSELVIFERNGIHYIDNNAFIIDKNTEDTLDSNFASLVESLVRV